MAQRFTTWLSSKWQLVEALVASTGASDAGKVVATNADGILDDTLVNATVTGGLANANKRLQLDASGRIDVAPWMVGVNNGGQIDPWGKKVYGLPNTGADQGAGIPIQITKSLLIGKHINL